MGSAPLDKAQTSAVTFGSNPNVPDVGIYLVTWGQCQKSPGNNLEEFELKNTLRVL